MSTVTRYKVQQGNQVIEFTDSTDAETYATDNALSAPTSYTKEITDIPVALLPAALPSYSSDPLSVTAGVYFNTTTNKIKFFNGSAWETVTSS